MITSLSSANLVNENVRRSADNFSFTDTIASFVNNRKFLEGYRNFKNGIDDKKSYIWEVLSAIGESTSEVIYNNTLNFIDNISNIDLCKVKALNSILSSFGLSYNILNSYNIFPLEIKNIIDVLSINKKYLLNSNVLKENLIKEISSYTISTGTNYIDDEKYFQYLSSIFYNLISDIINQSYCDELSGYDFKIFRKISQNILYGYIESKLNTDDTILKLKKQYNIEDFDYLTVVDNIENGIEFLENYDGIKKTILNYEIADRVKAKYSVYPETRYSYYKEKEVLSYFEFLKNRYYSINSDILSQNIYSINPNYFIYDGKTQIQFIKYDSEIKIYKLTSKETSENKDFIKVDDGFISYEEVISTVVKNLVELTLNIAKIREKVKLSLQKNYMKGTFNLLSYIINEFLIEYSSSNKILLQEASDNNTINSFKKHIQDDIELIEYYDQTEYFNLSTETSKLAKNKKYINDRFWENNQNQYKNNLKFAFSEQQIEKFYLSTLNFKNNVTEKQNSLMSFLSTIYSAGANKSYVTEDNKKIISLKKSLSTDNINIFKRFSGIDQVGNVPYYNHKNVTHSSYQVHPYLYNFIEVSRYDSVIKNSFQNDINQQLEDFYVLQNISSCIGDYGEVLNVALNNLYDFSGYRSGYEKSNHEINTSTKNVKNMVIDFDGAFYLDAINDLRLNEKGLSTFNKCCEEISSAATSIENEEPTYYEKYYAHLNLNLKQLKYIANQLQEYVTAIKPIVSSYKNLSSVFDIYKYASDIYGNKYILYKKYNSENPSYIEKQNTKGELWIRLKDHPIAFPAFAGKNVQIDHNSKNNYNNLIDSIINGVICEETYKDEPCKYFYDMEFDETKQYIILAYYPINNSALSAYTFNGSDIIDNSQFLICKIIEQYNDISEFTELQLNSDRSTKLDGYQNNDIIQLNKDGYTFQGFFKYNRNLGISFIKKHIENKNNNLEYQLPLSNTVDLKVVNINLQQNKQYTYFDQINLDNPLYFSSSEIKFNYYDNKLVFCTPIKISNFENSLSIQNYIGASDLKNENAGTIDYIANAQSNTQQGEMNSIDMLDEFIGITEFILDSKIGIKKYNDTKYFNLHSDPSYIPAYPGINGKINFSNNNYYKNNNYYNIELLGSSKNIDSLIQNVDINDTYSNIDDIAEKIKANIHGRVYESYNEDLDSSLQLFKSPYLSSVENESEINWKIQLDNNFENISNLIVFIYNKRTNGKNPYFIGNLSSLYENTELNYTKNYNFSEISCGNIKIAGTYDYFSSLINKSDSNEIYNIDSIFSEFSKDNNILNIKFIKENKILPSWIEFNSINVILININDLKIFNQYHYLDINNKLSGNVLYKDGNIIDQRKFLLNNQVVNLSDYSLDNYQNLYDVPYLSGDGLPFKYSEENVYNLSSKYYFVTGINTEYPKRLSDSFFQLNFNQINKQNNDSAFNESNLFIIQCNSSTQLSDLGKYKIPLYFFNNSSVRVFETYLSNDNEFKYDKVDPRFLNFVKFSGAVQDTEKKLSTEYILPNNLNIEIFNSECENIISKINKKYNSNLSICTSEFMAEQLDTINYLDFDSSDLSVYTKKDLDKYMNIYVNYKLNPDNKITLYFNYINYLNTPFIQKSQNGFKQHIINNTYLKLDSGENGILNIILQLKYYTSKFKVNGYTNIVAASYQIYNISDDKPKFLIYKK